MTGFDEKPLVRAGNERFARFEAIGWWDQARLRRARVLVVGAGALGNEVIKNIALLGIGHVVVADMDLVEETNLCRSVLFRSRDEGQPKAVTAARAAEELYADIHAYPFVGNVLADLGLGFFHWADVVIGCLDNREARVFVNSACARVGRPWIDGGIDVLSGVVRGFDPPDSSCYECTMGQADWDEISRRRSCSMLGRYAAAGDGAPTTPTTASIVGALQTQEMVKRLHGLAALSGRGFVFEGLAHSSYMVEYPVAPACPWHEPPPQIEIWPELTSDAPMRTIWSKFAERWDGLDAIDLSREIVIEVQCPKCGSQTPIMRPIEHVNESNARCDSCGTDRVPRFVHSLSSNSPLLDVSPRALGLPSWDIVWARQGDRIVGIELGGDRPRELVD